MEGNPSTILAHCAGRGWYQGSPIGCCSIPNPPTKPAQASWRERWLRRPRALLYCHQVPRPPWRAAWREDAALARNVEQRWSMACRQPRASPSGMAWPGMSRRQDTYGWSIAAGCPAPCAPGHGCMAVAETRLGRRDMHPMCARAQQVTHPTEGFAGRHLLSGA